MPLRSKSTAWATHNQYHFVHGSLTGHGEFWRSGFDLLFRINPALASLRDNVKRLTRYIWCTTGRASALEHIIAIFMHYHNIELLKKWRKLKGTVIQRQ